MTEYLYSAPKDNHSPRILQAYESLIYVRINYLVPKSALWHTEKMNEKERGAISGAITSPQP